MSYTRKKKHKNVYNFINYEIAYGGGVGTLTIHKILYIDRNPHLSRRVWGVKMYTKYAEKQTDS